MINLTSYRRIHILAVAGVGMSAIAQMLTAKGFEVTGSDGVLQSIEDIGTNQYLSRLQQSGVKLYREDEGLPVQQADLIVRSTAIRDNHPSWKLAQEKNIPSCHRSDVLAALLNTARGVALAGTHGKTTTTAMTGYVFEQGGLDPSVLVGGWVSKWKSNVRLGQSDWLVAEADESDGSFLRFEPEIAVVSNIEADHLDYFGDLENIHRHFNSFAGNLKSNGTIWVEQNASGLLKASVREDCEIKTYGWADSIPASETTPDLLLDNYRCENNRFCADLSYNKNESSTLTLSVAGRFNLSNAAAATGCGLSAGIALEQAVRALDTFQGTGRRQERIGEINGVTIIDDYAHHATEISVTLAAIKESCGPRRLVVLFQPHRYTRTRDHMDELAAAFTHADLVYIAKLYAASEDPIPGISAEELAKRAAQNHPHTHYAGELADAEALLKETLQPGDVLVTMGAGNVTTVGPHLLKTWGALQGEFL